MDQFPRTHYLIGVTELAKLLIVYLSSAVLPLLKIYSNKRELRLGVLK